MQTMLSDNLMKRAAAPGRERPVAMHDALAVEGAQQKFQAYPFSGLVGSSQSSRHSCDEFILMNAVTVSVYIVSIPGAVSDYH